MIVQRTVQLLFRTAVVAGLGWLAWTAANAASTPARRSGEPKTTHRATSADGTQIVYDTYGKGRALIIVNGALATRADSAKLAQLLATDFTVYSYDRRGRGDSTDTQPYSVEREIEDIAALIDAAGGTAFVYGKSSGACLALQAAAKLGDKVGKLAIYEAPYNEAEGAAQAWHSFRSKFDALLAANRRDNAVTLFLKFVGMPADAIAAMKKSPAWPGIKAMAPTLAYDNALLGADRAVPADTAAAVSATTLVMDGGASLEPMPYMRASAEKLGKLIPDAERRTIAGQGHDVDPKVLSAIVAQFFKQPEPASPSRH